LRASIGALDASAERGDELRAALAGAERRYRAAAARLSAARAEAAKRLPPRLEGELAELAMERTRCAFPLESDIERPDRWTARGVDRGELFISANVGEAPRPLARIASGGELSRVMLALKTLASTDRAGKTLVFDEVDAGISGRVADAVGRRLRGLGARYQVICITHLPQVAAHASAHYHVAKRSADGRTVADMTRLGPGERVEELARLIAGRNVTESARATARDMLAAAGEAGPAGESESKHEAKGESESRRGRAKERRGA
jgi:DNA repair protein RecN (Recombination protein N)